MLLRAAVGITLELQGVYCLVNWNDLTVVARAVGILAIPAGIILLIGYLTPFASVLAGLISVGNKPSWFRAPAANVFESKIATALAVSIAVALIFLGPGAFSVDARLFGRRKIIIPDASHLDE